VGGRFIPIKRFVFRPAETAQRYPDPDGPLAPNVRADMPRTYGDLAGIANRPDLRDYHAQQFTTDTMGFRNDPRAALPGPYKILVVGDSFAGGLNLSDSETLPVQLERFTGRKTYNGALIKVDLVHILDLTRRLQMTKGVIVYAFLTRQSVPTLRDAALPHWAVPFIARRTVVHVWHALRNVWQGFWKITPLEILAQRAMKRLENDRDLPNLYANQAFDSTLKNGVLMLQLPGDAENFKTARPTGIAGFLELSRALKLRNYQLVVVLVPDKYTVYLPLFKESLDGRDAVNTFLESIEFNLMNAGVPVLNLTEPLRRAARRELIDGKTIYARDDTHWNADGARIAARQIAGFLTASESLR
jgi:SGNH hydrolase-like domain, acetyltransferase AlgX